MAEVERRRLTEPSEAVAEHQHRERLLVVDDQCIPIRRGVELAGEFVGNEHLEFLRKTESESKISVWASSSGIAG